MTRKQPPMNPDADYAQLRSSLWVIVLGISAVLYLAEVIELGTLIGTIILALVVFWLMDKMDKVKG